MLRRSLTVLSFLMIALLTLTTYSQSAVIVRPLGFTYAAEEEDELAGGLTFTNLSEDAAQYSIGITAVRWEGQGDGLNRDDRGGPDDMEMEWRDSDEDDCPPYEWIDVTELENAVNVQNLLDDSFHGMFELGFEFPYYGDVYTEIGFHTNGFASFVDASAIVYFWPNWQRLPNAAPGAADQTPPPTCMAVNWQDLDPVRTGDIWFWTNESDMAVISWIGISHFFDPGQANGDPWTFQLVLFGNGLIKYQYAVIGSFDAPQDLVVGLQNFDRDRGFTVAYDQEVNFFEEEKVVAFGPPGAWITWLTCEAPSGEIAGNEALEVPFLFDLEGLEPGVHYANVTVAFPGLNQPRVVIPVILSYESPVGAIEGIVTNAADDAPLSDVVIVMQPSGYTTFTDEDGHYLIPDLPPQSYSLVAAHPDYFDFVVDEITVVEGETADGSMGLLHAEFTPSANRFVQALAPDDEAEIAFTAANGGNALLTYTTERRLAGGADADPWTLRASHHVAVMLEDNYIQGVVYIDDQFYVAGQHNREPLIYILDHDGNLQGSVAQTGPDNRGYNDLTWDGELIWGISGAVVVGFTPEGEERVRFNAPMALGKNIAWDEVNRCLWISGTTTDIFRISPAGENLGSLDAMFNGEQLRMYGLSAYPADPTGHTLYVYCKERDTDRTVVMRMNTANGNVGLVAYLDHGEGGSPMGMCITNQYDIYSWVLVAVCNNTPANGGDRVDVWQVDARRDWFQVVPDGGVIPAREEQEFTLLLNANDLAPEEYHGELVFNHDGQGGQAVIEVILDVREGRVPGQRTLRLTRGWNMSSVNLQPEPADDIRALTRELVDDNNLLLMKDGQGRFYNPEYDFCNIPGWDVAQGYMFKTDRDGALTLQGMTVTADTPIDLFDGWQMIAYYPRVPVDAVIALSGIEDQLILAKDVLGHFYNPEWEFSNMGNLMEGQGYQLKMDGNAELIYRLRMPGGRLASNDELRSANFEFGKTLPEHVNTGANMSLLALTDNAVEGEIGVYANGELVGSGVIVDGRCGIAVWGDDPTTAEIDGAKAGTTLTLTLLSNGEATPSRVETLDGELVYQTDAFTAVSLTSLVVPSEFGLSGAYPNPFNGLVRLDYNLPAAGAVKLTVYDLNGRLTASLLDGERSAGIYSTVWDASVMPSGLYFARLESQGKTAMMKLTLVR